PTSHIPHPRNYAYILVAGYGWSGSSAVVDILHEFKSCYLPGIEFRIIKDPYGLADLYYSTIIKHSPDIAIKDFISYMRFLYQTRGKFQTGLGYKKFFGENFMTATQKFVDSLVSFEYENYWWMFDFRAGRQKYILNKIMNKLMRILHLKRRFTNEEKSYFVNVSSEKFIEAAREYIDSLFDSFVESCGADHVVLDQAVYRDNYKNEMIFFRKSKLIVVDRDPRDNYADLIKVNFSIGKEFAKTRDVSKYISMHNFGRSNKKELMNAPNVLVLRFEDLIFHYDESLKRIAEFAELDLNDHVHKREFFNPDVSVKNVGMWKEIISQQEADTIASTLPEFLYNI
ncbi:MAG: sulfotransferase domain-containing protein, partial [Synergistaceae bacterium]|nr:sulfotransferase domain-containing protein [Synergistaceae bacterium]